MSTYYAPVDVSHPLHNKADFFRKLIIASHPKAAKRDQNKFLIDLRSLIHAEWEDITVQGLRNLVVGLDPTVSLSGLPPAGQIIVRAIRKVLK